MSVVVLTASSDEQFREMVRDHLMNIPNSKVAAEYQEVAANLYIRVMQDLERNPHSALVLDLAGDPDEALKALERVKQAAPDLYVIVSHYHADGETVIAAMRAGANEFLVQPWRRTGIKEEIHRYERAPKRTGSVESKLSRIYTFLGAKGGVGTTSLAVNFAAIQAQRKRNTVLMDLDWAGNDVAMQL